MRGQLVVVPILALLLLFAVPWWTLVLAPDWGTAALRRYPRGFQG